MISMMGRRRLSREDYVAIWRRRGRFALYPVIAGPAILYGISLLLPARFESNSLLLIQRQDIPSTSGRSVVTQDLDARVVSLRQQVLDRARLEPLIKRYDLFTEVGEGKSIELQVQALRKEITVTPVRPIVRSPDETLPGFQIAVTLPSAWVAQQVCAEVASLFIEQDAREREQSAHSGMSFLEAQLSDAKRQLDAENAKLAEFKRQYLHELPEDSAANFTLLNSLNGQLQAAGQALDRLQQDKTYTESLLTQQVAAWKAAQAGEGRMAPDAHSHQLAAMEDALASLEAQYTADHPDVVKLKAEIAQLKRKLHDQDSLPESGTEAEPLHPVAGEPPYIQRLRSQLRAYDDAIGAQTRTQQRLQERVELLQSHIQRGPLVEQAYKELTRDYQTALTFYHDMLKKKNESGMAAELEWRQQADRLVLMEPARLPASPTFPNRPLFALAGFGGGLLAGFFILWLPQMRDKSLHSEKDVEAYLGLPTLAAVPNLIVIRTQMRGQAGEPDKFEAGERRIA